LDDRIQTCQFSAISSFCHDGLLYFRKLFIIKQVYFTCYGWRTKNMKAFPALLFALAITAIIGIAMFIVGGNALLNQNTAPVLNAPPAGASGSSNASDPPAASSAQGGSDPQLAADQQQIAQMQNLINQYQAREKTYQTELKQAAQKVSDANAQLAQANQQLQVFQQVMQALQERGIIRITQDGTIELLQGGGF
jgi:hypothetical protein